MVGAHVISAVGARRDFAPIPPLLSTSIAAIGPPVPLGAPPVTVTRAIPVVFRISIAARVTGSIMLAFAVAAVAVPVRSMRPVSVTVTIHA